MALDASNLAHSAIGAKSIHHYDTTDAIATVTGADYFLGSYRRFNVGDVIIAVCSTGGTRTVDVLVVQTCTASGMTVINGT